MTTRKRPNGCLITLAALALLWAGLWVWYQQALRDYEDRRFVRPVPIGDRGIALMPEVYAYTTLFPEGWRKQDEHRVMVWGSPYELRMVVTADNNLTGTIRVERIVVTEADTGRPVYRHEAPVIAPFEPKPPPGGTTARLTIYGLELPHVALNPAGRHHHLRPPGRDAPQPA